MSFTLFLLAPLSFLLTAEQPLLVKTGDGIRDGAVSYAVHAKAPHAEIALTPKSGDPHAIAALIQEKLPGAEVAVKGDVIVVKGKDEHDLLERISALALPSMPEGALAMEMPEAGGSIRVGRDMSALLQDGQETFRARVLEVKRGAFPEVTLRLKLLDTKGLKKPPKSGTLTAPVAFARQNGKVDFASTQTQRNLLACYLKPGDEVQAHAAGDKEDQLTIDFIERR